MAAPLLGRDQLPDRITPQTSIERTAAHAQTFERRRGSVAAISHAASPLPVEESDTTHPPRVLVVYTGGTIGMKSGPNVSNSIALPCLRQGYEPAPNYLASMLRGQPAFHNRSMQGLVPPDFLITPHSIYGRNISYRILEFTPLLDSSCMSMAEWSKVCFTSRMTSSVCFASPLSLCPCCQCTLVAQEALTCCRWPTPLRRTIICTMRLWCCMARTRWPTPPPRSRSCSRT